MFEKSKNQYWVDDLWIDTKNWWSNALKLEHVLEIEDRSKNDGLGSDCEIDNRYFNGFCCRHGMSMRLRFDFVECRWYNDYWVSFGNEQDQFWRRTDVYESLVASNEVVTVH